MHFIAATEHNFLDAMDGISTISKLFLIYSVNYKRITRNNTKIKKKIIILAVVFLLLQITMLLT